MSASLPEAGAQIWIARVREGDAPARSVRLRSEGPPGPDTELEEIDDPFGDPDADPWALAQAPARPGGLRGRLGEFRLAPPVRARKVIGIGRNYAAHAAEMGNEVPSSPMSFFKAPTCLLASGDPIEIPPGYDRIDMEAELVVVIGRRARGLRREDAWDHIAGYSLGNDVSCRDLQKLDKQWTRAKGFDTFGPLGPFVRMTPPGFVPPIDRMRVHGYIGDERRQDGACDWMIFDIPTLLEHLSEGITLEPGDIIYTGTPEGVSQLGAGTVCAVEVEGFALGRLTNPCVALPTRSGRAD